MASTIYTYDVNGNLIREEFVWSDGTIESATIHTYDNQGNRIKTELDQSNNGTVEEIYIFSRDESGNVIRDEKTTYSVPTPQVTNYILTYDVNGNVIKREGDVDNNDDGTMDRIIFYTWEKIEPASDQPDLSDAIEALQVLVGMSPSTPVNLSDDVNGDSRIGLEEAIHALQVVSGIRQNGTVYSGTWNVYFTDTGGEEQGPFELGLKQEGNSLILCESDRFYSGSVNGINISIDLVFTQFVGNIVSNSLMQGTYP